MGIIPYSSLEDFMTKIRFALAQMNPTVGDFSQNTRKIISWIQLAEKKKSDLIVFPEQAVSGYPVWDLANKRNFVDEGLRSLDRIVRATRGKKVTVVVGFIDRGISETGRSRNALAWIEGGNLRAKQYKRLLPTYDVFLENIFFEPAKHSITIPWKKWRVGPTICEDIWESRYEEKPIRDLVKRKVNLIVNISASPYYRGVAESRDHLLKKHAAHYKVPFLYVNQVGGQDDLIFDGRSLFVDAQGRVLFRAPAFEEDLFFFDWRYQDPNPYEVPVAQMASTPEEIYGALTLGIRDYCRKNGFQKVIVGLSGGIDSALVAALAVEALGSRAVTGVTMPGVFSSRGSWEDSRVLARRLGIEFRVQPISKKFDLFLKEAREHRRKQARPLKQGEKVTLAVENLQARLRGLELMFISNDERRLLLSTGNKSELAVGYCTLYGDMAGGLSVLGDVYKTDVYRLAWFCNRNREVIPQSILLKAPSAELRPNQKDEDSLPPYEILDQILYLYIEKNLSRSDILQSLKKRVTRKDLSGLITEIIQKVDHNEYKRRQAPPILRVTEKAWFGRRMPITNRFKH